jgi:hypothetical protein
MEEGEAREMGTVTLADMPGRRHLPCSLETFPPSIEPSCIEREVEIEKTEACGMEEGRGTRASRRKVRGGEPNMPLE